MLKPISSIVLCFKLMKCQHTAKEDTKLLIVILVLGVHYCLHPGMTRDKLVPLDSSPDEEKHRAY